MKRQGMQKYVKTGQGGFTLIELLIVVAIIGILAAIAIPRYQDYVKRSEVSSALATVRGVQTGVEDLILRNQTINVDSPGTLGFAGVDTDQAYGTVYVEGAASGSTATNTSASAASGAFSIIYSFDSGANTGKYLTLSRNTNGTWSCISDVDTPALPDNCVAP